MDIIRTEHLTKIYPSGSGELVVLNDLSIQIPEKSLVMLQGRSGSGKTTLINILSSLEEPTSGDIIFNGKRYSEINDAEKEHLRRTSMGFVFQSVALIPIMTAYENIDFGLRVAEGIPKKSQAEMEAELKQAEMNQASVNPADFGKSVLNQHSVELSDADNDDTQDSDDSYESDITDSDKKLLAKEKRKAKKAKKEKKKNTEGGSPDKIETYIQEKDRRIREALRSVGLEERMSHIPSELSGGEQQRVAIARAFIHKPAVIFADEPTGALDTVAGINVVKLFRNLVDEYGLTIVMSTHDRGLLDMADVVFSLENGNLMSNS